MSSASIIIPCFNEEKRLDTEIFKTFICSYPSCNFIFVNDGSTDKTLNLLVNLIDYAPQVFSIVNLPKNVGKGEAVRQGILVALASETDYVGYWDADLATPLDAIPTFCALLDDRPALEMVMGARVRLLGRIIERNPLRHYLGRVFATAASIVLGMGVYDTQCGAKLLRASALVTSIFQQPFLTRWLFDVEILARLIQPSYDMSRPLPETIIYEFPLYEWRDIAGSKVKPHDFFKSFLELSRIYYKYFVSYNKLSPDNKTIRTNLL